MQFNPSAQLKKLRYFGGTLKQNFEFANSTVTSARIAIMEAQAKMKANKSGDDSGIVANGFCIGTLVGADGLDARNILGTAYLEISAASKIYLHGRWRPWIRVCGVQCFLSF